MPRFRRFAILFAAALALAAILYGLPTLLELRLLPGHGTVVVLIGDLFGCILLAFSNWRKALVLYVGLTIVEWAVLATHLAPPAKVVYFLDLIPAVLVVGGVLVAIDRFATAAAADRREFPR